MNNCMGIIITQEQDSEFGVLCAHRPLYMLPYGGRYRLIDFTISNMVNHSMNTVAVFTGEKIRSTMDHLGNGRPWDLNRRFKGLFIFPPLYRSNPYQKYGDLGEFKSTESFFQQTREDYVLIADPAYLSKVDLKAAFAEFLEKEADIGLVYTDIEDDQGRYLLANRLHMDDDDKIISIGRNLGNEVTFPMHIGLTFLKKELLRDIVFKSIELGTAYSLSEALLQLLERKNVVGIKHDGHIEYLRNMYNYYRSNLNLLDEDVYDEMFYHNGQILTKAKDEPSTFYGKDARVVNSIIANGCNIEGEVINSVVFRGVKIGKGSLIKNSIIMQKADIGKNAAIINTITDKMVTVEDNVTIAGTLLSPYIAEKERVIKKEVTF